MLISFTPGAGAINTMNNSLTSGFRHSIWGIFEQQAALIVHIIVVALGVGVLVAGTPILFNVIRYAGAAYLVFLGIRLILQKPDPSLDTTATLTREPAHSQPHLRPAIHIRRPAAGARALRRLRAPRAGGLPSLGEAE